MDFFQCDSDQEKSMKTNQSLGTRANLVSVKLGLVQSYRVAPSDFVILTSFCIQDVFKLNALML